MKKIARRPLYHYWTPNYWLVWIGLAFLRVTCLLPYRWQMRIGSAIGRLAHWIGADRRAVARRNIELCFPELSVEERNQLARRHFESLGMSLMEMGLGRWASDEKLCGMTSITGAQYIQQTIDSGYGVILLSAHFTTLEISGRVLKLHCPPFDAVFRRFRSDFTTEIMASGREVSARRVIEKNDIKTMVRSLREGTPVWYAPDQSYGLKQSALLPFFGVPTMTNTATGPLAKLGKAKALPFFPRRMPGGGYELTVLPPLENVPSGDADADTLKYVAVLEDHVRRCPEQYFWVHRKFKNRPDELPDAYEDLDSLK
ncbi:MAG: lipid A biosynthesis acyltransferase [Proteobacteria bacterium]|nr:lipid A biosynthesis acyltransferase [Pseudomonadota bacterium]MDA0993167.1 lipid A biosynthesis acyltransferase [Pseudomonadota bacterium]